MSPTTIGRIAFTAAALAVLVAAGSCKKPEAVECGTGIFCPAGYECAKHVAQCITGKCGNGNIDAGEICDDGGTLPGDVIPGETPCSADCKSDESCGNGVRDVGTGEVCDCGTNPLTGKFGCDPVTATDCVMEGPDRCMSTGNCGNGKPDGTEECDQGKDGKPAWGKTCNIDCTNSKCGDGKINPAVPEYCDGGNGTDGQSIDCNDNCTASVCGDGRINPLDTRMPERDGKGEECDDGTTVGNNWNLACLPTCLNNVCGDGHRNTSNKNYEDCDDGPSSKEQRTECDWTQNQQSCTLCSVCHNIQGAQHWCGDGKTDDGHEACDEGSARNVDNITDSSNCVYGNASCKLCSRNCQSVNTTIKGPLCGDTVVNTGTVLTSTGTIAGKYIEQCDNVYSMACGTCNSATSTNPCRNTSRHKASATLVINDKLADLPGVTVKVTDGVLGTSLTFEYVTHANMPASGQLLADGNIPIEVAGDRNGTATNTDNVIGPAFPNITADASGAQVTLENDTNALAGNTIIEVGNNSANALTASPMMTGGVGCIVGQQCSRPEDCSSNICTNGICRCNGGGDCPKTTCSTTNPNNCWGTCNNGTCQ